MAEEQKAGQTSKNLDVLLVDNDEGSKSTVEAAVRKYMGEHGKTCGFSGYTLHCAPTPEQGLKKAREIRPEIVIAETNFYIQEDFREGIEGVLKPLRQEDFPGKIMCWSYRDHRHLAIGAGADAFVTKDYSNLAEVLYKTLIFLLPTHKTTGTSETAKA